jgi:hypothetical protein
VLASAAPLLLLNIYCPDRDVGVRLQFTPASTVEEALEQTVRRLFSALPPATTTTTTTSSTLASVSPSSGDQASSLEEAVRKPWRFLCLARGSNEGGSPFFLYRDRTLASYDLHDEVRLPLRHCHARTHAPTHAHGNASCVCAPPANVHAVNCGRTSWTWCCPTVHRSWRRSPFATTNPATLSAWRYSTVHTYLACVCVSERFVTKLTRERLVTA